MRHRIIYTLAFLFATLQTFAQTYTYDNLNRLTKVVYDNGATVSYTYDVLGNRTSKKVTGVTSQTFTVTVAVTPEGSGTVTGGGTYAKGSNVELNAIANNNYKFSKWNDGKTENPRTVTVNSDLSFTAHFIKSTSDTEDTDITKYDNILYINRTEAAAGTSVTLSVNMKNAVQAEGFGFDLYLPTGVTVAKDADGFPEAYLSTARTTDRKTNTFEAAFRSDGSLRVFAASTNGSVISGNDGEVCTVKIDIANNVEEGEYPVFLRNVSISDVASVSHDVDQVKSTLAVKAFVVGDANNDGKVTVADYTAIAHHILGNTPNNFNAEAADANGDGKINVADYTAVAHIILYGSINRPNSAPRYARELYRMGPQFNRQK